MGSAVLTVDLDALVANWRRLDRESAATVETAAVIKADGYGLGAALVGRTLVKSGVRSFFVAQAEEGAALRATLGPGPEIFVLSGHMRGDTDMISDLALTPVLNALDQLTRHLEALPGAPFGVQLDSGMNRLGLEPAEWAALRDILAGSSPRLVMSHLACADAPEHPMNRQQLQMFREMTAGIDVPLSLAATGGILLGPDYHFDLTRPGVGIYGGAPLVGAEPVVTLSLPVIQTRDVRAGESVGYSNAWIAPRDTRIATLAAGYADGLIRAMGGNLRVWAQDIACDVVGRVSMDMLTVDIGHLRDEPQSFDIICEHQTIDQLANVAGTIGYEILTSLGNRYSRRSKGQGA